jgi:hypothetical protein
MGLLAAALCAQERGARVLYLGVDLPALEIAQAARGAHARAVVLGLVFLAGADAAREIAALRWALPAEVPIWLGGAAASRLPALPEGIRALATLDDLEREVALLAAS